jgi:Na+-transporting methylmalonyl-CoA/oxaloacetate decarboxylase gamma subunit
MRGKTILIKVIRAMSRLNQTRIERLDLQRPSPKGRRIKKQINQKRKKSPKLMTTKKPRKKEARKNLKK